MCLNASRESIWKELNARPVQVDVPAVSTQPSVSPVKRDSIAVSCVLLPSNMTTQP